MYQINTDLVIRWSLAVLVTLSLTTNSVYAGKDGRRNGSKTHKNQQEEGCAEKICEPSKCPNVGPIEISSCPAKYIQAFNCGCCKRCAVPTVTTTLSPTRREEVCKEVTCPKKKVCVLNIQGLPVCKCPNLELCKKYSGVASGAKKRKVCGSDGVTYPSRCHLKVASCNSAEKKIRVVSRGDCQSTSHNQSTSPPSIQVFPPKSSNAQEGKDVLELTPTPQPPVNNREARRKSRKEGKRKEKRLNRKKEKAYTREMRHIL